MAEHMTFDDAAARFANLASTGITIEDAIQEAVDSYYDMGRWPNTTKEVDLDSALFSEDSDGVWTLKLDGNLYGGAIGMRNKARGFGISDIIALYREHINAGDLDFVDLGEVTSAPTEDGVPPTRIRNYRCPLGFSLEWLPMQVLIKKVSPRLSGSDAIIIPSVPAFKAAIRAVCYEFVSDDNLAGQAWAQFERNMVKGENQFQGMKRYSIGMDSSLRRRPSQFR